MTLLDIHRGILFCEILTFLLHFKYFGGDGDSTCSGGGGDCGGDGYGGGGCVVTVVLFV